MKNLLLTDFVVDKDWVFLKHLGESDWICIGKQSTRLHDSFLKNLVRYAIYFIFPLQFVFKRSCYGKIVAYQQFFGLNFAFWCRVFHLKKRNDLTVMTFIYKKKLGRAGLLYHKYMSYVVTSQYIDRFICFSKEECAYYANLFGVDKSKFIFCPLGKEEPLVKDVKDEGYIFATGLSNRDYDFLVDALKYTDYRCVIACDAYKLKDCPANTSVLNNCYGESMLNLMAHCHCVVVPLKDLRISSGQLVVLQAMSLGKPVICTHADGIIDYVENEVTGYLIDNKKEQLLSALHRLYEHKGDYDAIAKNARVSYLNNFTVEAMFRRIAHVINIAK